MLRGVATVNVFADDVAEAAGWYADLLGVEPYFRRPEEGPPAYVEFRVGDLATELGIVDRRWAPPPTGQPGGGIVYWAVDDLAGAVERLVGLGASEVQPITDRGPGFATAAMVDPFGNVLAVMTNRHFEEVVSGRR